MTVTIEFKTEADARIALAMLKTLRIDWKVADVEEPEKRDVPLIVEERW